MEREIALLTGIFLASEHHRSGAWPTAASIKKAHDAVMLIAKEAHARREETKAAFDAWEAADDAKRKAKWEAEQKQREADFVSLGKAVLQKATEPAK